MSCPGRSAACNDALQTRDRFGLGVSDGPPLSSEVLSVRSREPGNPEKRESLKVRPWIPACAGTNGVSDSACVTISQSLILMVRRRGAPSRTMRPGIATLDWWPHPSRRPPSLALRRAPQDEVLGLRGQRPADLKNRKSVPIASSSLANAPPPGRGRAPGFALCFSPPVHGRGGWSAGRRIQQIPRLAKRGARLATTRAPAGAPQRAIRLAGRTPFSAAIFRRRAALSRPVAGSDQPAPGGGFVVTPGRSPGTPALKPLSVGERR